MSSSTPQQTDDGVTSATQAPGNTSPMTSAVVIGVASPTSNSEETQAPLPISSDISRGSSPPSPHASGCFSVSIVKNCLEFYYQESALGQITPEHLDLMGQIEKTEAVLKALFYPEGLPDDVVLRKPHKPSTEDHSKLQTQASQDATDKPKPPDPKKDATGGDQGKPKLDQKDAAAKRKLTKNELTFQGYYSGLIILAEIGLEGPTAQPWMAKLQLADFKDRLLVGEGGRARNRYLRSLGEAGLTMGLPTLALILILEAYRVLSPSSAPLLDSPILQVAKVLLFAWTGAMIGTWVSYAIRNPSVTFEQLAVPEEDRLKPTMRLVYVGLLACLFVSALILGLFTVVAGSFDTRQILSHGGEAFLIGALCGIGEKAIGQKLQKEVGTIAK